MGEALWKATKTVKWILTRSNGHGETKDARESIRVFCKGIYWNFILKSLNQNVEGGKKVVLPRVEGIWRYKLQDHDHDIILKKLEEGLEHTHHAYNDD